MKNGGLLNRIFDVDRGNGKRGRYFLREARKLRFFDLRGTDELRSTVEETLFLFFPSYRSRELGLGLRSLSNYCSSSLDDSISDATLSNPI